MIIDQIMNEARERLAGVYAGILCGVRKLSGIASVCFDDGGVATVRSNPAICDDGGVIVSALVFACDAGDRDRREKAGERQ
jgi:hypothetical protein